MTKFYYLTFQPWSEYSSKYVLIPAGSDAEAQRIASARYTEGHKLGVGESGFEIIKQLRKDAGLPPLTRLIEFKLWRTG